MKRQATSATEFYRKHNAFIDCYLTDIEALATTMKSQRRQQADGEEKVNIAEQPCFDRLYEKQGILVNPAPKGLEVSYDDKLVKQLESRLAQKDEELKFMQSKLAEALQTVSAFRVVLSDMSTYNDRNMRPPVA